MPVSAAISAALTQAGIRLLEKLIERARDRFEETDSSVFIIVEHLARALLEPPDLRGVFDAAQEAFCARDSANQNWLDRLATLFEHSGTELPVFADNLWRAYLFHIPESADALWAQYPRLQRKAMFGTDDALPPSWGAWIFPLRDFLSVAGGLLAEAAPAYEDLVSSEDVLEILEESVPFQPMQPEGTPLGPGMLLIPPGEQFDWAATLNAYLVACHENIGHINPYGYPRSSDVSIPLDDIYVALTTVPFAPQQSAAKFLRYQKATYDNPELHVFRSPLGLHEAQQHPGLATQDVLARHRLLLILGENGAGKTTLLRHLVFDYTSTLLNRERNSMEIKTDQDGKVEITLVRPLPIYVDLATYIEERENTDETLQDFILRTAVTMTQDNTAKDLLIQLLEDGKCIILLDGLDQAATDEQRRILAESVTQATAEWAKTDNQIVVTSRITGYASAPLPDTFANYLLRPLDRSQIAPLLLRWTYTLARVRRPTQHNEEALQASESQTLALTREVTANPQLRRLAGNPLNLRMLAGIYQPGLLILPQQAAICQMVADALIRHWRLPQDTTGGPAVIEQEVTVMLSHLAYWLHASRPAGMVGEEELHTMLGYAWKQLHPDVTPEQVREALDDLMQKVRSREGVLIELAPQHYGFVYHALQEYFAARYLVASYRLAGDRIREHLHDPRWDEVIRLAIGFTSLRSQDDASDLIETAILARGPRAAEFGYTSSGYETYLQRDLFFAARLLGSGVGVSPRFTQMIVQDLMSLWLGGDRDSVGRFNLIFDQARCHLTSLDGTPASQQAFQIAREALTSEDEYTRAFATDALSFWPSHAEEASHLLADTEVDSPLLVRWAVANALGRTGHLETEACRLLLTLASGPDEEVAKAAQTALRENGPISPDDVSFTFTCLKEEEGAGQRVGLRLLQHFSTLPDQVIDRLLHMLGAPDYEFRQSVAETLGSIPNLPQKALMALCRAASDPNFQLRAVAIDGLARPILLPKDVIEHLRDWTYDPEVAVRRAATLALGACLNDESDVIEALIDRLDDPADSMRADVIEVLVAKGHHLPTVRNMITHAARDTSYTVRRAIALAFRHFTELDEDLRETFKNLLSDREVVVREAALEAASHLGDLGPKLIDIITSMTAVEDHGIGAKAVQALSRLRGLPEESLFALVDSLRMHWKTQGQAIADCLKAHTPLSMDLISQLIDLAVLQPSEPSRLSQVSGKLQALALEILGSTLGEAPDMARLLIAAARENKQVEVQVAALRGLAHARNMWPDLKEALLVLIEQGPVDVRCTAGMTLGRLIRNQPNPPFESEELQALAGTLAGLIDKLAPRASWESGTQTQNELLLALYWVASRACPKPLRLAAPNKVNKA